MKHIIFGLALDTEGTAIGSMTADRSGILAADQGNLSQLLPTDTATKFQIVTKKTTGGVKASISFSQDEIVKVTKLAYSAGTAQVITVTPPALPAVQAVGDTYSLKLIKLTPGTANQWVKTYTVVKPAGSSDYTATTLLDAFRTLINADTEVLTTAAGTTTMTLTGDNADVAYAVAAFDLMAGATLALTTPNVPSTGTGAKIVELEKECQSYQQGNWNKVHFPYAFPLEAVASSNYYLTILDIVKDYNPVDGSKAKAANKIKLYIAEIYNVHPVGDLF